MATTKLVILPLVMESRQIRPRYDDQPTTYHALIQHQLNDKVECKLTESPGLIGKSDYTHHIYVSSPLKEGMYSTLIIEGVKAYLNANLEAYETIELFIQPPIMRLIDPTAVSQEIQKAVKTISEEYKNLSSPSNIVIYIGLDQSQKRLISLLDEVADAV